MEEPDVHQENLKLITQIEEATNKMVNEWDYTTLLDFAYNDRVDYYCNHADEEEVQELLMKFHKE